MDKVDIVIIGAGVIGLAIAERLSRESKSVILTDKEHTFGLHSSSRNSEVIHSGIYYKKNSFKADFCIRGNESLYEFLKKYSISHRKCGKLIVALKHDQENALETLYRKGIENGVAGLEFISSAKLKDIEPSCKAKIALYVPSAGIFDTHQMMSTLEGLSKDHGTIISYRTEVNSIAKKDDGYILSFKNSGYRIFSRIVINAAGLWSDKVFSLTGMDPASFGYTLHLNKGEYYKTSRYKNFSHLIYPPPDTKGSHLGIHTVSKLNGELSFGPNSYYVNEIDYSVDNTHYKEFFDSISQYLDIDSDDIWPDNSGIRPKLQALGEKERDFVIGNEKKIGLPNFINLIGIESPGLTCSLSIAEYIATLLEDS